MRQAIIPDYFQRGKQPTQTSGFIYKYSFSAQPLLTRHLFCDENCLDFKNIGFKDSIVSIKKKFCSPLSIFESLKLIKKLLDENQKCKRKTKKRIKKYIKKKKSIPLTIEQREKIVGFYSHGISNSVIAFMLQVTPGQVRMNKSILKNVKVKQEIHLSDQQNSWLLKERSKSTNTLLFNSKRLLKAFQRAFNFPDLKDHTFRKILHSLNINYRVPSLKPLLYFQKQDKNLEVYRFREQICGYTIKGHRLIFIDECSIGNISRTTHKQWHLQGSFKQSLERISWFTFVIAAMGERNFLFYQVIEGTGKAYIFKHFLQNLLMKAEEHYDKEFFVIILDNATVHKNEMMSPLLNRIPHVFTPSYRPDLNGIEHLFSWIKRYVVKEQPFLFGAFQQSIHRAFSNINENLLNSWTKSILKPMYKEISNMN